MNNVCIIKNTTSMEELSRSKKIYRTLLVLFLTAAILTLSYFILVWTGLWDKLNSVDKIRRLILGLGFWGRVTFVLLQFLQVTFLPLPSPILIIAGSLIFGAFQSALLSLAGILLGSAFAFFLGRFFGTKLVSFMVGKKTQQKWSRLLGECRYSFVIMMLLPCFPDDVLCLVAGITDMSWTFFMVTQFVARPIGVFSVSYLSNGEVIPYSGWGLVVWAVIIVASLTAIFLASKYNKQIENFIKKLFKKDKTSTGHPKK